MVLPKYTTMCQGATPGFWVSISGGANMLKMCTLIDISSVYRQLKSLYDVSCLWYNGNSLCLEAVNLAKANRFHISTVLPHSIYMRQPFHI